MVVEQILEPRLRVIESAVDSQRMHIGIVRRRHLPALHLADAAMGIEDEHIHIGQAAERLDRGRAGIARCRAHDGDAPPLARQGDLEQLADQLHREILEGQRRAMEQLEQVMAGRQLHQRRARGMAEALIGPADGIVKLGFGKAFRDKGADDAEGRLLVGQPFQRGDGGGVHLRNGFGHIKAPVARKAGHHRLGKGQNGRLPAGRDIAHRSSYLVMRRIRQTSPIVIPRQITAKENHWIA